MLRHHLVGLPGSLTSVPHQLQYFLFVYRGHHEIQKQKQERNGSTKQSSSMHSHCPQLARSPYMGVNFFSQLSQGPSLTVLPLCTYFFPFVPLRPEILRPANDVYMTLPSPSVCEHLSPGAAASGFISLSCLLLVATSSASSSAATGATWLIPAVPFAISYVALALTIIPSSPLIIA